MPANKNALIRYKTIDNCLRNRYRRWTLEDLVEACSEALYDMEGIRKGVSVRTVQGDIQMMRSDKLGYNAPIEVYDHKYYRYADSAAVGGLRAVLRDGGCCQSVAGQVGHHAQQPQAHHPFRQRARPEGNPPTEPLVQLYRTQADAAHHVPVVLGKTTI